MQINCILRAGYGHFKNQDVAYPAVIDAGRIDGENLLKYVESSSCLPAYQLRAALQAVADQMRRFACAGHSVEVPGFGVFSLDVKGKVVADEDGNRQLEDAKGMIKFVPMGEMRTCSEKAHYQLVSHEVMPNAALTDNEAQAVARKLTDEHGWFMQKDFMRAVDASRAFVSRLLAKMVDDGSLVYRQVGHTKMYRAEKAI